MSQYSKQVDSPLDTKDVNDASTQRGWSATCHTLPSKPENDTLRLLRQELVILQCIYVSYLTLVASASKLAWHHCKKFLKIFCALFGVLRLRYMSIQISTQWFSLVQTHFCFNNINITISKSKSHQKKKQFNFQFMTDICIFE